MTQIIFSKFAIPLRKLPDGALLSTVDPGMVPELENLRIWKKVRLNGGNNLVVFRSKLFPHVEGHESFLSGLSFVWPAFSIESILS